MKVRLNGNLVAIQKAFELDVADSQPSQSIRESSTVVQKVVLMPMPDAVVQKVVLMPMPLSK
jgi:hypothetical protein